MSDQGTDARKSLGEGQVNYGVRVVKDDALEGGVDWAFVRQDGNLWFLLKESVTRDPRTLEAALEDAWSTNRSIDAGDLLSWAS